jgi:hypothetical protein
MSTKRSLFRHSLAGLISRLIPITLLLPTFTSAQERDSLYHEMQITGVYQGNSLYIQNPYYNQKEKFCISHVVVNKKEQDLNYRLSALKLDFNGIALNSPVSIHITHMIQCTPKIVNPLAIYYHSNFKFTKLILNDTTLYWETKGDRPEGLFTIEQLNYDYWSVVNEIQAKGIFDGASYEYPPSYMAGPNKFRVKYSLPSGQHLYSEEIEYVYYHEPVTFHIAGSRMVFSAVTEYEIQDQDGKTIIQGEGKEIPIRYLRPGDYVLLFDEGRAEGFTKK